MEAKSMNWGGRARLLHVAIGFAAALVLAAIAIPNLLRSRMASPSYNELRTAPLAKTVSTKAELKTQVADSVGGGDSAAFDRKVIRTGSVDLVVDTPSAAVEQIAALAREHNGYVVSSELSGRRENQRGNIMIRVPAAQFDAVREQVKKLAKQVESEQTSADDVTMQYAENEATLRNYRAEEASYLEIMKRSGSIKDTLAVAQQVSDARGRIERLEAAIRTMSVQTEMTAITINVSAEPVAAGPQRWRPLYELQAAWKDGVDALATYATAMMAILLYLPAVLAWAFTIALAAKLTWMLLVYGARLFRAKPTAV
jgi:Domain of unknown function (DUF4349)